MTRSNRLANRVILALVGLVALALAAVVAWPALHAASGIGDVIPESPAAPLADVELSTTGLWIVVAAAVVLIVLSLLWAFSRGRGRTSTAVRDAGLEIDVRLVQQLLEDALGRQSEVVAVSASAHRVRRTTAVRVRVDARRGADLRRLVDAIDIAVEQLDAVLGSRLPLLVHITSGLRAGFARERRAV